MTPDDARYCRAVLPRVSRTFAINIRLLAGPMGDAVRIGYLLCRAADTLEDSWPGAGLERRFDRFLAALAGDAAAADELARAAAGAGNAADLDLVAHLPRVLSAFHSLAPGMREPVRDGVRTLAEGMCRYGARAATRPATVPYLDTTGELEDYCWVVAGCVGVMLTRLHATAYGAPEDEAQRRRLELAPIVGRALQLTNILLDWPTDVRRGRCYLPADWLAEHRLAPADLVDRERPEVRALVDRLETQAFAALRRVPDYLDLLPRRHLRYRLFCLWPAMWAVRSLRRARRDPQFPWGPRRPKLPRLEIYRSSLGSLLTSDHGGALRRLCEAAR
jgi:farnesyl-diphosphate farnesyltransferase